jgi:hypothetical protein
VYLIKKKYFTGQHSPNINIEKKNKYLSAAGPETGQNKRIEASAQRLQNYLLIYICRTSIYHTSTIGTYIYFGVGHSRAHY